MSLKHSVTYGVDLAARQTSIEFLVHVLPALLVLSAELLSIIAAGHFVEPVAESLPSTYLAMMHHSG
jgi:hypothetical protein